MLFGLFAFGGFSFTVFMCLWILILIFWTENEKAVVSAIVPLLIGIVILIGLTSKESYEQYTLADFHINYKTVAAYFGIGTAFFLIIFQMRLKRLKKYLDNNPHFKGVDEKGNFTVNRYVQVPTREGSDIKVPKTMDSDMYTIYQYEPSFVRFFDRVFCWPCSVIRIFLTDIVKDVYCYIRDFLVNYKNQYLNS